MEKKKVKKKYKCPQCGNTLKQDTSSENERYFCDDLQCRFFIGKAKFEQIVNDLYKPKKYTDNFEELQNLGRKENSEDFSDSKHLDY